MKKNIKRIGLVTFLAAMVLGTFSVDSKSVQAAELGTPLSNSLYTPTPDPSIFLNIWNTSGYSLQPAKSSYTVAGNTITLNTETGRSVWDVMGGMLDAPHYRWYKSDDGVNWNAVPASENGNRKNFAIPTSQIGRTWYQMDTQYYNYLTGWALKTHLYSNVAEVNAVENPINASAVSVTSDSDYIYNNNNSQNNTTFVKAETNPLNSTGTVTWDVDNKNLATVDNNGKVTANSKEMSGVVTVTGTFHNMDSSYVIGSTHIRVGGGLADQTVSVGDSAVFTLQGNTDTLDGLINQSKVKVDWYKKVPGSKKTEYVGQNNQYSYSTDSAKVSDNGTQYQAKVTLKDGRNSTVIKTNWATLNVSY